MKRPEVAADAAPGPRELHFVHRDGPSVRVERYAVEGVRGIRYVAELYAQEGGVERAVIEARSTDELGAMIEPAARAFSLSIRQRSRSARPVP